MLGFVVQQFFFWGGGGVWRCFTVFQGPVDVLTQYEHCEAINEAQEGFNVFVAFLLFGFLQNNQSAYMLTVEYGWRLSLYRYYKR